MADTASVSLQPLTAFAWEPGGLPSAQPLTAFAWVAGGNPSMRSLTATAKGASNDATATSPQTVLQPLTAAGVAQNGNPATAAVSLQKLTGSAKVPTGAVVSLQALTAAGVSNSGQNASATPRLLALTASGLAIPQGAALGSPILQPLTASARGTTTGATGSATLLRLYAQAAGLSGTLGSASPFLQALTALAAGSQQPVGQGVILIPRLRAYSQGETALSSTLDAYVMNTRTNAVSRYPSYNMNSFARYNDTYLGAGPNGLFLLEDSATADNGVPYNWSIKTGQLDDKFAGLKRLVEVVLGCRYDGPVKVRVWTNDTDYNEYSLPNLRPSTLQQVRVKPGKGARSRYFQIEILGTGTRFEVDSLQATMPQTTRRIG